MSEQELLTLIEKAIRDVANNPTLAVKAESRLIDDLNLESIDLLDISSELENGIGQELDFREVAEYSAKKSNTTANMKSIKVSDMIDYIQSHA